MDKAKMKSAERQNKMGLNFIFWNYTLSFYTLILFVHIIVIFISTDSNTIPFAPTQQYCEEIG